MACLLTSSITAWQQIECDKWFGNTFLPTEQNQEARLLGIDQNILLQLFHRLYEKYAPQENESYSYLRIPKIIHQIWIGTKVPDEFKTYIESWQKFHPDWEYRLWTQDDIHTFGFENIELILQSRNAAQISDIMRYEILLRYGGVYVDMDMHCLRALDELHYFFDFYVGIQPLDCGSLQLGIGIIGSKPNHPIVRACIDAIQENWHNKTYNNLITVITGPINCTKMFFMHAGISGNRDIALPPLYFYPLGSQEDQKDIQTWFNQGSYAVHYWAKSWLYPSFRRPEFRNI